MVRSLQEALRLLGSDKIRERSDGLEQIRSIFEDSKVRRSMATSAWLRVMQSLFECVMTERREVMRKGGTSERAAAVALRRLREAAQTVRWMVEECSAMFQASTALACFNHFTQSIVDAGGELFQPLALDYVKALRALLDHQKHLVALEGPLWSGAVGLCFNMVLNADLRTSLTVTLDGSPDEVEDSLSTPASLFPSGKDPARTKGGRRSRARLEDVEALSCVEALLRSDTAPIVGGERLGVHILARYARFLDHFSDESSAHLPALCGLNGLLSELVCNEVVSVRGFARDSWKRLVQLWASKNRILKEQVVLALRTLLPFVSNEMTALAQLHSKLLAECDQRAGFSPLPQASISMTHREIPASYKPQPFEYGCMRSARRISVGDAQTWAALELGADVSWAMTRVEATHGVESQSLRSGGRPARSPGHEATSTPEPPMKRPRLGAAARTATTTRHTHVAVPTIEISTGEVLASEIPSRVWRLQVELFLILRHFARPQGECMRSAILSQLNRIIGNSPEGPVVSWALTCAGALAHSWERTREDDAAVGRGATVDIDTADLWKSTWSMALRRTSTAATCRAACFAASAVLRTGGLVDSETCYVDTQTLLSDLDLQGPALACDSACELLSRAIILVSSRGGLNGSTLRAKALAWLRATWTPIGGRSRASAPGQLPFFTEAEDGLQLLGAICSFPPTPLPPNRWRLTLQSRVATQICKEAQIATISSFMRSHRLDALARVRDHDHDNDSNRDLTSDAMLPRLPARAMEPIERSCYQFLLDHLQCFEEQCPVGESSDPTADLLSVGSADQLARAVDLSAMAILFNALCELNRVSVPPALKSTAAKALGRLLMVMKAPKWTEDDRGQVMAGLGILASASRASRVSTEDVLSPSDDALLRAGPGSGVGGAATDENPISGDISATPELLRLAWKNLDQGGSLRTSFLEHLDRLTSADCGKDSPLQSRQDAAWAIEAGDQQVIRHDSHATDPELLQSLYVAALACLASTSSNEPRDGTEICPFFLNAPPERLSGRGMLAFLVASSAGEVHLSDRDTGELLDMIGVDILGQESLAKQSDVLLLAVSFLDTQMPSLHGRRNIEVASNMEKLGLYLLKQASARGSMRNQWRAKTAFARFLQRWLLSMTGDHGAPKPQSRRLQPEALITHLIQLVADDDARVRFEGGLAAARLLEHASPLGLDPADVYARLCKTLPENIDDVESMLTRVLTLGNVMVADACTRDKAFYHLLELCFVQSEFRECTSSVLEGVAQRLGFPRRRELWLAFARPLTWLLVNGDYDVLNLPCEVLGFSSRREMYEEAFESMASMLIAMVTTAPHAASTFRRLAALCRRTEEEATRECLAFISAIELGFQIEAMSRRGEIGPSFDQDISNVRTQLGPLLRRSGGPTGSGDVLDANLAQTGHDIVAHLLLSYYFDPSKDGDGNSREEGVIPMLYEKGETGLVEVVLEARAKAQPPPTLLLFRPHEPSRPFFSSSVVAHALRALRQTKFRPSGPKTVYHVVATVAARICAVRFVNDQVRHTRALIEYVAVSAETIATGPILIRQLLHICAALMTTGRLWHCGLALLAVAHKLLGSAGKAPPDAAVDAEVFFASDRRASKGLKNVAEQDYPILATTLPMRDCSSHAYRQGMRLSSWVLASDDELVAGTDVGGKRKTTTAEEMAEAILALPSSYRSTLLLQRFVRVLAESRDAALSHLVLAGRRDRGDRFFDRLSWQLFTRSGSSFNEALCPPSRAGGVQQPERSASADLALALASIAHACRADIRTPLVPVLEEEDREALGVERRCLDESGDTRPVKLHVLCSILDFIRTSVDLVKCAKFSTRLRVALQLEPELLELASSWATQQYEELALIGSFEERPRQNRPRAIQELASVSALAVAADGDDFNRYLATLLCEVMAAEEIAFWGEVAIVVQEDSELASSLLSTIVHGFLQVLPEQAAQLGSYFHRVLRDDATDTRAKGAIVGIVLHLRRFTIDEDATEAAVSLISPAYLELAKSALGCGMYASALLFLELARDDDLPAFEADSHLVTSMLYGIYSNIDDADGFYGVRDADLDDALLRRLRHEGRWARAFELQAARYEASSLTQATAGPPALVESLHHLGFHRLGGNLLHPDNDFPSDRRNDSVETGLQYGIAWRSDAWDLPRRDQPHCDDDDSAIFDVLRSLQRDRSQLATFHALQHSLTTQLTRLGNLGIEATKERRSVVRNLLGLREIAGWVRLIGATETKSSESLSASLRRAWSGACEAESFDFEDFEVIASVRLGLLRQHRRSLLADSLSDGLGDEVRRLMSLEQELLMDVSNSARRQARFQVAHGALAVAKQLDRLRGSEGEEGSGDNVLLREAFADVLWAEGETSLAIQALEKVASSSSEPSPGGEAKKAAVLAKLGSWRATARTHQPHIIENLFFRRGWELLSGSEDSKARAQVAFTYAKFSEAQYRHAAQAGELSKLQTFVDQRLEELKTIEMERSRVRPNAERANELARQLRRAKRMHELDNAQLQERLEAKKMFLLSATAMYAAALIEDDTYDDAVVRLTSLWFEGSGDAEFNATLASPLLAIPSHKFVQLSHQLSARLTKPDGVGGVRRGERPGSRTPSADFQRNLYSLMLRMCKQHPFHTLYALYALRKGAREDSQVQSQVKTSGSARVAVMMATESPVETSQLLRGAAAEEIIAATMNEPRLTMRIQAWEALCNACVEWAEMSLRKSCPAMFDRSGGTRKGPFHLPSQLSLRKLRNMEVPVITSDTPLDPTGEYRSFVAITRYSESFTTAGGIHLPKITECIGSDGRRYKQLFKSADDLRQDAVMEQVFRVVNGLLRRDRSARRRELLVRTYAVVPLGPQCGLLEFVQQTLPLSDPIMEMHQKYGSAEISPMDARGLIMDASRRSARERVARYVEVCDRIRPKLRFFFLERHKLPLAWLGSRLNYARSVATTSIVGHVLGLGDRHVSNILLDKTTGEVVHIDFGVAFEQGKLLPVPELVPFRLTRDVIDPMGMSGVDGVFRRCSEETLRVLREGADVVKTILEVFKFDPLFDWASSPVKVLRAQVEGEEDAPQSIAAPAKPKTRRSLPVAAGGVAAGSAPLDTAETLAERSINTVMEKLSGKLSVEYAVNDLIQQATDPSNLGIIFHGWQAAL